MKSYVAFVILLFCACGPEVTDQRNASKPSDEKGQNSSVGFRLAAGDETNLNNAEPSTTTIPQTGQKFLYRIVRLPVTCNARCIRGWNDTFLYYFGGLNPLLTAEVGQYGYICAATDLDAIQRAAAGPDNLAIESNARTTCRYQLQTQCRDENGQDVDLGEVSFGFNVQSETRESSLRVAPDRLCDFAGVRFDTEGLLFPNGLPGQETTASAPAPDTSSNQMTSSVIETQSSDSSAGNTNPNSAGLQEPQSDASAVSSTVVNGETSQVTESMPAATATDQPNSQQIITGDGVSGVPAQPLPTGFAVGGYCCFPVFGSHGDNCRDKTLAQCLLSRTCQSIAGNNVNSCVEASESDAVATMTSSCSYKAPAQTIEDFSDPQNLASLQTLFAACGVIDINYSGHGYELRSSAELVLSIAKSTNPVVTTEIKFRDRGCSGFSSYNDDGFIEWWAPYASSLLDSGHGSTNVLITANLGWSAALGAFPCLSEIVSNITQSPKTIRLKDGEASRLQ